MSWYEAGSTVIVGKNESGMSERMLAVVVGQFFRLPFVRLPTAGGAIQKKSLARAKWGRGVRPCHPSSPARAAIRRSSIPPSSPSALVVGGIGDGVLGFSSAVKPTWCSPSNPAEAKPVVDSLFHPTHSSPGESIFVVCPSVRRTCIPVNQPIPFRPVPSHCVSSQPNPRTTTRDSEASDRLCAHR